DRNRTTQGRAADDPDAIHAHSVFACRVFASTAQASPIAAEVRLFPRRPAALLGLFSICRFRRAPARTRLRLAPLQIGPQRRGETFRLLPPRRPFRRFLPFAGRHFHPLVAAARTIHEPGKLRVNKAAEGTPHPCEGGTLMAVSARS